MSARPITVKPTTIRKVEYTVQVKWPDYPYWITIPTITMRTLRDARARQVRHRTAYPDATTRIRRVRQTTVSEVVQ